MPQPSRGTAQTVLALEQVVAANTFYLKVQKVLLCYIKGSSTFCLVRPHNETEIRCIRTHFVWGTMLEH